MDEESKQLVSIAATTILRSLGFYEKIQFIKEGGGSANTLALSSIQEVLHAFYASIYNSGHMEIPVLQYVHTLVTRDQLRKAITAEVVLGYEFLYNHIVQRCKEQGKDPKDVAYHDTAQIKMLLDAQ